MGFYGSYLDGYTRPVDILLCENFQKENSKINSNSAKPYLLFNC